MIKKMIDEKRKHTSMYAYKLPQKRMNNNYINACYLENKSNQITNKSVIDDCENMKMIVTKYKFQNQKLVEAYTKQNQENKKLNYNIKVLRFAYQKLQKNFNYHKNSCNLSRSKLKQLNDVNTTDDCSTKQSFFNQNFKSDFKQDYIEESDESNIEKQNYEQKQLEMINVLNSTICSKFYEQITQKVINKIEHEEMETQMNDLKQQLVNQKNQRKKEKQQLQKKMQNLQKQLQSITNKKQQLIKQITNISTEEKKSIQKLKQCTKQIHITDTKIRDFINNKSKILNETGELKESPMALFLEEMQYIIYLNNNKDDTYTEIVNEYKNQLNIQKCRNQIMNSTMEELKQILIDIKSAITKNSKKKISEGTMTKPQLECYHQQFVKNIENIINRIYKH